MKPFRLLLLPLLTCTVFLHACKKEEAVPAPLINNGDMEQKFQGWFPGFASNIPPTNGVQANPNGYIYELSQEASSSPVWSFKVSCTQVKDTVAFFYYGQNSIPYTNISIGAKLTLKAKIKTALVGPGVSIVIRGDKGSQQVFFTSTQGKTPITGTKEFTEYSLVLDSYPGGIDNLLIYLVYLPKTTGSVYFDDVSMTVN